MSDIAIAAVLAGTVLLASTVSVEIGLSVALIELLAGFVVGNALHLDVPSWLSFLGSFAGIVLTFQAGAEVDVPQFRREWRASLSIGLVSFFAPFAVVALARLLRARLGAAPGGDRRARALDDEPRGRVRGARRDRAEPELVGKRLMSATFVTDIATVAGADDPVHQADGLDRPVRARLGRADRRPAALAARFFRRYGNRVIEPEIKLVFAGSFC